MAKRNTPKTTGDLCWSANHLEVFVTMYPRARLTINGQPGVVATVRRSGRDTTIDLTPMSDEERQSFEGPSAEDFARILGRLS